MKCWTQAAALLIGDLLKSHDGRFFPVESTADTFEDVTVYNMRIAEYHTYFVGRPEWNLDVWAHNADYGANDVLQTGGHTLTNRTRKVLGLSKDKAKQAIESLKGDLLRGASEHGHKIMGNGDVIDSHTGILLGNLFENL